MNQPDFWQNQEKAKSISRQSENLKSKVNDWDDLAKETKDLLELAIEAEKEQDLAVQKDLIRDLNRITKKFEKLDNLFLFSGKYDSHDAILAIHAGTGGTEAQDWAQMLLRMLLRYCEKKDFTTKIIDETSGQEAGIKSVTVEVFGHYAYGNLKSEAGVHRLVRISPFDAEKMRHTSFALVEVMPVLEDNEELEIKPAVVMAVKALIQPIQLSG